MKTIIDLSGARTKEQLARKLIQATKGRMFSCAVVTAKTSAADPRVFNCRFGVHKNQKGGKSPAKGKANLIVVWENNAKHKTGTRGDYRTLNLSNLIWVQIAGRKYTV